ncbi:M14 family metallopeptidase [soil metagenome]
MSVALRSSEQLLAIQRLADAAPDAVSELARVEGIPILVFRFGNVDPATPVLLITGGVHGLERIGSDVAIAFLSSIVTRRAWDRVLHDALARCRVVVLPLVNPVGMMRGQRANGSGVDLMRNGPAHELGGTPLLGGQRLSPRLPWYMGPAGAPMQPEAETLISLVEAETFRTPLSIALDLHSGYGFRDRLWYPYARTREPIADLPAVEAFGRLLDAALPNHIYRLEQTAQAYTIRGDLWDHLYDRRRATGGGVLLPLTLEMGSWMWVRKSPLQALSTIGRFNPVVPHRHRRTLRRHIPLLELLLHAAASHHAWLPG